MALNNNVGATIQAVFSDPGLYNQIAQKSYLPEAVSTLWNAGNALKEQSLRGQIADELSKPSPNMNTVMELDAARPNNADPTSTFRWKQSLDQQKAFKDADLERIKTEKANTKEEQKQAFMNKLNATLPTMTVGLTTTPEQAQMYKNTLAGLEADAANYGITDKRIADLKNSLYGDLPYNAMMAEMDILNDINANYGKGPDYDKMNEDQRFKVFQKKLEEARDNLMNYNPDLWDMMKKDNRYNKLLTTLLSNRRPKSKGKEPPRAKK